MKVLDFGLVRDVTDPGDTADPVSTASVYHGHARLHGARGGVGEARRRARRHLRARLRRLLAFQRPDGFRGREPVVDPGAARQGDPPPLSSRTEIEVPARLEEILMACLAKSPDDRPRTAQELGDMLADLAASLPAWTRDRAEKWWRTNLPALYAAPLTGKMDDDAVGREWLARAGPPPRPRRSSPPRLARSR